jgi:hypothetical protein
MPKRGAFIAAKCSTQNLEALVPELMLMSIRT